MHAQIQPAAQLAQERSQRSGVRSWLGAAALFAFALAWFVLARDRDLDGQFLIDEAEWIGMGVVSYGLATTGTVPDSGATAQELELGAADPWRSGISESTFGWMNPVYPKLALGAVAHAAGVEQVSRDLYPRFYGVRNETALSGRRAARNDLLPALFPSRVLIAVLAAGIALALFALARMAGGTWSGIGAYGLWLASPTAREVAVYVRTDLAPMLFGLAALWWFLIHWRSAIGARDCKHQFASCLILGGLCGLAVGSKLNGALVSFAVPLWFVHGIRIAGPTTVVALWRGLLGLCLVGASCAAVFWLSLPALWGSWPWNSLPDLFQRWDASFVFQVRKSGEAVPRDWYDRIALVAQRALFDQEPLRQATGLWLGLPLAALGLMRLIYQALRAQALQGRIAGTLLLYLVVVLAGTTAWLPMDRDRFYQPLLPWIVVLEAVALGNLSSWLWSRRRRTAAAATL